MQKHSTGTKASRATTSHHFLIKAWPIKFAGVVELEYTRDLKSLARKGLRVRLPPPAPRRKSQRVAEPHCSKPQKSQLKISARIIF